MHVNEELENKLLHLCGNPLYLVASMYINPDPIQKSSIVELKADFLGRLEELTKQPATFFGEGYKHSSEEQTLLEELYACAINADWTILEGYAQFYKIFGERFTTYTLNSKGKPRYNPGDAERFLEEARKVVRNDGGDKHA